MRQLKKCILIGILAMAAVVAVALAIPPLVNTEPARQSIARSLENALGREVSIAGTLRFMLLPHVGFVIEDLRVADPGGFGFGETMRLKRVAVALAPLALLRRELVFESIRLQSPQVNLLRNARGQTNWDGLGAGGFPPGLQPAAGSAAVLLRFNRVAVIDGVLRITDAKSRTDLRLSEIDFVYQDQGEHDFSLSARMACPHSAFSGVTDLAARIRTTGRSSWLKKTGPPAIARADLAVELLRPTPSGKEATLAVLEADLRADAAQKWIRLEKMALRGPGGRLQGSLIGRFDGAKPSLTGRLRLQLDDLKTAVATAAGRRAAVPAGPIRPADLNFALAAEPEKIIFSRIRGRIDRLPLTGAVTIAGGDPACLTGTLSTGTVDLDAYLARPSAVADGADATAARIGLPDWPFSVALVLDAESIAWRGQQLVQPHLEMHAAPGGDLHLDALTGSWADGRLSVSGRLQATDQTAQVALALEASNLDVGRLWAMGGGNGLAGRMDADVHLKSRGADLAGLCRNANVDLDLRTDGAWRLPGTRQATIAGTLQAEMGPERSLHLKTRADMTGPKLQVQFEADGALDRDWRSVHDADATLSIMAADLPPSHPRVTLDGRLSVDTAEPRVDLQAMNIRALGLECTGDLRWQPVDGRPVLRTRLKIGPVDARQWFRQMGLWLPAAADPHAWGHAGLDATVDCDGLGLSARDLTLTIDDTTLKGIIDISPTDPIRLRFMLDADRIDLDRYLPVPGTRSAPDSVSGRWALAALGPIDMNGTLTIGRLDALRLSAEDVFAQVRTDGGQVHLDPLTMSLYSGTARGRVTLALDGSDPAWRLRASLRQVALHDPLEAIFGLPVLSGRAQVDADLSGRRRPGSRLVAGLGGRIDLVARQGVIHGIQIVPDIIARPNATDPPADHTPARRQPFDEIRGSWRLVDGVAANDDLRLSAAQLNMAARGVVDFVQQRLDALLTTDIRGIPTVYYTLKGPFDAVAVQMDRGRLAADTAAGIVAAPLTLGRGALGVGAELLEQGGQAIGDGTGIQQMGQGAMTAGKGVLKVGKGVLDIGRGTGTVGQGVQDLGQGALEMGQGVVGVGEDALGAGIEALKGLGKWLQKLFGNAAGKEARDGPAVPDAAGDDTASP